MTAEEREAYGRAMSIKFTVIFGIFSLIPLVLMYHFLSFTKKGKAGKNGTAGGPPAVAFREVTTEAGVNFVHQNGASGEKLLPETMGGGCAFFDFDGDGDQDLFLVNSSERATGALLQNDGAGKFADVTPGSGLDVKMVGMGAAVGDFDNDGKVDLFLTGLDGNRLFRNLGGGKFEDLTERAGVRGGSWSTSAAWIDYDNDGDLDLFVCNYVQWSREIDLQVDYRLANIGRAYGPPMSFAGTFPYLYRNDGGGKFSEVAAAAGMHVKHKVTGQPLAKSLGVAPTDMDNDGWIDLVVANDTVQNFVFHNQKNGTFREVGATTGVAFDVYGAARGAMGIDTGRFQDENTLGISIGNFANEMTALYVQQTPMLFSDQAIGEGIGAASRDLLTFGVFFFDYDLDGWLDLLTVNGHIEPEISKVTSAQKYLQPARLFWNARGVGGKGFVTANEDHAGRDLFEPLAGRGSAYADVDGDGDLDVLIMQVGGAAKLFRNERPRDEKWARLKLVGAKSNRDAIGAVVKLRLGNKTVTQTVMPTRGYLSQSELPVTVGFGGADKADEALIIWPDGSRQTVKEIKAGAETVIRQN